MRIQRIELPGFGSLSGFNCDLGPGLNLLYGENEAGKSTLQQAVCAMLYGFFENDRALRDETARHERFRPWGGGPYRGALSYELDDGRAFEVRRDFSTTDIITQVIDSALGADVTAQFGRGRHGNIPFARKHLGMSRGVFQSCAFISQGEIFDLDRNAGPSEIGDAIAALADSARRDVSAAKAIERLEAAMSRVGSDRARTAELPIARERLKAARDELKLADDARRAMAEKSRRLDDLCARARQLAETTLRAEYLLHRAEATRLRGQLQKLAEIDGSVERAGRRREELRDFAAIPTGLRDDVIALRSQLERADEALTRLRTQRDAVATQITDDVRLEYETLRESAGALTEDNIRVLQAAAYYVPLEQRTSIWSRIAAAIANAVRAIVRFILRRPAPAEEHEPPAVALPQTDALALLEKHRRYLTLRPLIEDAARLDRQIEAETDSRDVIERRLSAQLGSAGVAEPSLPEALAAFEECWRNRKEFAKADAAAEDAARRRGLILSGCSPDEIEALAAEHEAEAAQLQAADERLVRAQTSQTPEQLARSLHAAREEKHATEVAVTRLDEEVRLALSGYRPRAEIEEGLAHWEREVKRLETARAALAIARATIQEAMTAVYRDFAPAVNSFLSEGMEAATGGRYRRAHVDPSTLRVSLLVPETDQVVTDPPVSHGTRTLLYVLMRIGLAQHMSAIGESVPLVLDDPFVDVDSRRLPRILDFLAALSERMQILIFTKDREILDWFEQNARGERHRLHIISGVLTPSSM